MLDLKIILTLCMRNYTYRAEKSDQFVNFM